MIKKESNHRGLYFFGGFVAGVICVLLACIFSFKQDLALTLAFIFTPIICSIFAFAYGKKPIGWGILTAFTTAPLIFFGTCLANFKI